MLLLPSHFTPYVGSLQPNRSGRKFFEDKANGTVQVTDEVKDCAASVIQILSSVYDSRFMTPEDANSGNVEVNVEHEKLKKKAFIELWERINHKSFYTVSFDHQELIRLAVQELDRNLTVSRVAVKIEYGEQVSRIESKEQLEAGSGFTAKRSDQHTTSKAPLGSIRYDLVGKLVEQTGLTRETIATILQKISPQKFALFAVNPEEFILKAAQIINNQKAARIIEHITYNKLDAAYDTDIFTGANLRGKLGTNAMEAKKSLFSHIIYDSQREQEFACELDISEKVAVYVKLPGSFFISTPVGKYNPDWAIAFVEGAVKHIYFVAETKGSTDVAQLREVEAAKIACARAHFAASSSKDVIYDVVDSYNKCFSWFCDLKNQFFKQMRCI